MWILVGMGAFSGLTGIVSAYTMMLDIHEAHGAGKAAKILFALFCVAGAVGGVAIAVLTPLGLFPI